MWEAHSAAAILSRSVGHARDIAARSAPPTLGPKSKWVYHIDNQWLFHTSSFILSPRTRMDPGMNLAQLDDRDIGVDLGGVEAGVAEQLLDEADIGTVLQSYLLSLLRPSERRR
jgi:hypothetical protein